MNNHKIFKWIQISLCILPLFVPSWATVYWKATITYDEANVTVFDTGVSSFESEILKSLQTTKNFFAREEVVNGVANPEWQAMTSVLRVLQSLLAEESDWKVQFSKTILEDTRRHIVLNTVHLMEASITILRKRIGLLSENNTNMEHRKMVASIIHTEIQRMSLFFDNSDSLFKRYPLIATPPLVALALFVAVFDPIAQNLIPFEANNPQYACKMRNILLDYRPRAVYNRLEKLRFVDEPNDNADNADKENQLILPKILFDAISRQYNQYGYNTTIPATISCEKGCKRRWDEICTDDEFGAKYMGGVACPTDYALLLRHRVEKLFPIELLNTLCKKQPETTGFGWLTIKLRSLCAHGISDEKGCDWPIISCDPFVRLFIDGEQELETQPISDTACYDLDVWVTSKRISKSALVKIEIIDSDLFNTEELIFRTEGNIDSFLWTRHRGFTLRPISLKKENYIEYITFWQDSYKYVN